jgi:hypothetical protein
VIDFAVLIDSVGFENSGYTFAVGTIGIDTDLIAS